MIRTIINCRICTRGGVLAAVMVAALFASSQVTCLTHPHCDGADCFEHQEESPVYESDSGCGHESGSSCEENHQAYDIHHHSHDGKTHPQRRFTAPADEPVCSDETGDETPVFSLAAYLKTFDESPPLDRYGLIFAERAPPLR